MSVSEGDSPKTDLNEDKFCGNCKYGPVPQDWAWILRVLERNSLRAVQGWLIGQKLHVPGAAHRLDEYKTRFVKLNEKQWCNQEKVEVHSCDVACFAWQPRDIEA